MSRENWIWMPHTGHFCIANECQFRLNTYIGNGIIVSTVGELRPLLPRDNTALDLCRKAIIELEEDPHRKEMLKFGYEDVRYNSLYETMVFKAWNRIEGEHQCCPYGIIASEELDVDTYNYPKDAYDGHMALCEKWSKSGAN